MADITPDQASPGSVLGWCKEAIQEGQNYLRSQRGYPKIAETIDAIMGDKLDFRSQSLSSTTSNHLGKVAEDLAGALTDVRPFWEYTTRNKRYEQQAVNFGRRSQYWWRNGGSANKGADLAFSDVIKYGIAGATGWAHLTYSDRWGDTVLEAEDPRDVIPVRPSSFDSIQDALAVCVRRERTVNYVRGLKAFKGKEGLINATRDGTVRDSMENTRAGKLLEWLGSPFRERLFSNRAAREIPRIPVLDLFTMYVDDRSRNTSSEPRYMGEWHLKPVHDCIECINGPHPATNWSYKVEKGELLYPNKRLILFTDNVIGYDGPSPYWHGLFPLCKLTLVPYPWSWLGKAPLWDLLPLQRSLDKLLRVTDDHFEKIARPDIVADKNSMSEAALSRIDTRKAGLKVRTNALAGKGFDIRTVNPLPAEVAQAIEFYISEMDSLSGIRDLSSLMNLQQLPEADTVEKIQASMTTSVRLRSRVIEAFMREFAQMLAFNFLQFDTLPMRLAMLGEDGMTFEDFDYDPGSMVPDFIHSEDLDPLTGAPTVDAAQRGVRPRYERAKAFMQHFSYEISASSLLASAEVTRQMKYLQLARAGWMDIWTLFDVLNIPNGGEAPAQAKTIPEKIAAMNELGIGMNVNPAGRKASGQSAPRQVIKES